MESGPEISFTQRFRNYLFASTVLLILLILGSIIYSWYLDNDSLKARKFTSLFHEREVLAESLLTEMKEKSQGEKYRCITDENLQSYTEQGIFFYCLANDSLEYWSSNYVPIDVETIYKAENNSTVFLENGFYFIKKEQAGVRITFSLIGIYHTYRYQNEYLQRTFFNEFPYIENVEFINDSGEHNITSLDGNLVGSLVFEDARQAGGWPLFLIFILFIAFILILEKSIFHAYESFNFLRKRKVLLYFFFLVDLVILRLLIYLIEIPGILFNSSLFDPYGFSSSLLNPSIGDAIINVFMILMASYLFFKKFPEKYNINKAVYKNICAVVSFLVIFILFRTLISFVHSLVLNSSFSFNLQAIYSLDSQSLLGIILISTATLSFVFASLKLLSIIRRLYASKSAFLLSVLFISIPFSLIEIFVFGELFSPYILLLIYFISYIYFDPPGRTTPSFGSAVYLILLFAFMMNLVLNRDNSIKEKQYRSLILSELSAERDPWLEFEFTSITESLPSDKKLQEIIEDQQSERSPDISPEEYIMAEYLDQFEKKYRLQVTLCNNNEVLEIQPQDYIINCFRYFDTLIETIGEKTLCDGLFFLKDETESHNYLGIINLPLEGETETNIFIELYSRLIPEEGLGYPDLLLDKQSGFITDLADYSYARYRNGNLSYKFGDYPYNLDLSAFYDGEQEETFFELNDYSHLIKKIDEGNYLVVSRQKPDLLQNTAPFSFLFLVFVIYVLLFTIFSLIPGKFRNIRFNFRDRLQFAVIIVILLSFVIIGIVSRTYIVKLNEQKNNEVLQEKTLSVLIEIEHKLGSYNNIYDPGTDYIADLLYKFSLVFFSDINLYDTNGYLVVSSRPEIFEAGLISRKINRLAYNKLQRDGLLEFIHTEHIGKQKYLSSYMPFRNNNDEVIAYLNLPYFAKQKDLQKEISSFLIAYVNIYILTVIFAIITTLIVAKYVTRPLEFIRNKMRTIKLGDPDAKITWKHEDEIGSLVSEYNRMLDVIAESAEKLARSERETAWREMAQQVAHEIKNPLTPMKLNVQYLKKSWDEKTPGWEEKFEKFTSNMIEQIDSLSEIASAFSDFAKMPGSTPGKVDLYSIANQAIDLYEDTPGLTISFRHEGNPPFNVKADRKQILRMFNNLIRNSIQAVANIKDGRVDVKLFTEEGHHVVEISDNGVGITEDQAQKIFRPNFTTKTGGMGLGLAIVYNIVKNSGGEITFSSKPGAGTSFFVRLPVNSE